MHSPSLELSHDPLAAALGELAIAFGRQRFRRVPGKPDDHDLSRGAQLPDRGCETGIARVRSPYSRGAVLRGRTAHEIAQIHAESRRGTGASERLAHFVVAAAERDRVGEPGRV